MHSSTPPSDENFVPLCVDLDGTLIKEDSLFLAVKSILLDRPFLGLRFLPWIWRGRAYFKKRIADHYGLGVDQVTFNQAVVQYIEHEKKLSRKIILVSAANEQYARRLADHAGLFDQVLASDEHLNLKGSQKARELVRRYGSKGFDYMGNSISDIPIWKNARKAILVYRRPVELNLIKRWVNFDTIIQCV